jgi:ABC-type branched-subunit amino acid transport system ATPase component
MTSGSRTVLEVRDATRSYGGLRALDGATLAVEAGGITGIIGPNGAGKSTLAGAIGGQIPLEGGEIHFDGARIDRLAPHRRAQIGLMRTSQLSSQFDRLTVLENLMLGAPGQRGERFVSMLLGRRWWWNEEARLVDEAVGLLKQFGMFHKADELAGSLSGGQKRLVEITRALMSQPQLLLLDEPMAGVSPALIPEVESALQQIAAAGVTIVMIEHELGIVERLCREVAVMARGKVIAVGALEDVRNREVVTSAYIMG